ncbi:MAG: hypothetical protein IJS50_02115 [Desulfovibrio sp.]|nr:hypothetical protein [Desulfovibrio sp.]
MRAIVFSLLLFFSPIFVGLALAESQPPVHHEYNNSNVYYGTMQDEPRKDDDYGIKTYIDPATGDRVTSVRSRPQTNTQNQMPMHIEPIIRPW